MDSDHPFLIGREDADGDTASTTITVKVKDDAPDAKDDGRTTVTGDTITGNVTSNDVVGQDTPGTVTKVVFNNTTYNVPATGTVTINGTYGTLTIDKTGAYTYVSKSKVDGVDKFTYTLKDNDGDTDTAVLSIDVNNENCIPQIIKPADEIVDETDLANGVITETGTVTANFSRHYRYTGAALTTDLAWLIGAAFAPLVALGVSAKFGLVGLVVYLLSGALCTLAALGINRAIESREQ